MGVALEIIHFSRWDFPPSIELGDPPTDHIWKASAMAIFHTSITRRITTTLQVLQNDPFYHFEVIEIKNNNILGVLINIWSIWLILILNTYSEWPRIGGWVKVTNWRTIIYVDAPGCRVGINDRTPCWFKTGKRVAFWDWWWNVATKNPTSKKREAQLAGSR